VLGVAAGLACPVVLARGGKDSYGVGPAARAVVLVTGAVVIGEDNAARDRVNIDTGVDVVLNEPLLASILWAKCLVC
jgi:hypothetical protein